MAAGGGKPGLGGAIFKALVVAALTLVALAFGSYRGVDVVGKLRNLVLGPAPKAPAKTEEEGTFAPGARLAIERLVQGPPRVDKVVYLNREGARLFAGVDDAPRNRSSIVRSSQLQYADIPAFTGSHTRWKQIVKCIRTKFAKFDIQIVEQRPIEGDYIMALFGGTVKTLGAKVKHKHATGLAPFLPGEAVQDGVVLIFSTAMRNSLRAICETASMEIAHVYGLDHAYHCRDLMTYRPYCGSKTFLNKAIPCGEHRKRTCANGDPTQNSHQMLMDMLGPAKK